jgi:hypothetical protein
MGRIGAIKAQVCETKLHQNLSQQTHPIYSIRPKTNVLGCFKPFCYCTKVGAKLAELVPLMHKFAKRNCVRIFSNERTRSAPLDPKLKFRGISDYFVTPRKSVQNGSNWCTTWLNEVALECFTKNALDPLHWIQNSCFGAFRTILLLHKSRCKIGRTGAINAQVREMKLCQNVSQCMHPIPSNRLNADVSGHFGPFLCFTKVSAKREELVPLMHNFVK